MSDEKKFDSQKFAENLRDKIHNEIHDKIHEGVTGRRPPMKVGFPFGSRPYGGGLIWGVILTVVGVGLLLDHLGIISFDRLWRFWPLFLIFAGIVNFRSPERRFWGIMLLFAGAILQLNQLGYSRFGWAEFWPVILIAAGLMLMWNALEARKRRSESSPSGSDPRTTLNEAVVFGGLERRMTSQDFQGGDVTAIFGGVELDLTEASIKGDQATLAITAIFGGVEVRVPSTWQVAFRGSPIFGGVEDKTRTPRMDDPASSSPKTLVITGAVIFGGLEIKN
jgi:predicted membrane protein